MEERMSFNGSNVFTQIHPCYQIDLHRALSANPSAVCVLLHVFLGSLSVVTVCGNLLVIVSIIYFKQLHTPTNSLVVSLAVADLLVGALVFPLTFEFSIGSCRLHSNVFCQVRGTLDVSLCTSSILNLCCIAIDRYYAVCRPLSYRTTISDNVVTVMVLASWGLSALIALSFVIAGVNETVTDVMLANTMGLLFSFYLPVLVMIGIYVKIFHVAQTQARSIRSTKCGAAVSKTERKATKTLATVMGVFLLCWLPFFVCTTVLSFSPVYLPLPLVEFLNWLALSNSMLNPFIYAFFYSWFRSAFRMIISGKVFRGDFTDSKLH